MNSSNYVSRTRTLYFGLALCAISIFIAIGFVIYFYWQAKIYDNENGYNGINAVIALMALLVNIITVVFVFATFRIQSKQITENKKDTDYNRALDLIFRQLEHTNSKLSLDYEKDLLKFVQDNMDYDSAPLAVDSLYFGGDDFRSYSRALYFLAKEFEIYNKVIDNTTLDIEEKRFLSGIAAHNLNSKLIQSLNVFQNRYQLFQTSDEYPKLDSSLKNNIEYDLFLVLGYLRIPQVHGLELMDE